MAHRQLIVEVLGVHAMEERVAPVALIVDGHISLASMRKTLTKLLPLLAPSAPFVLRGG